MALDISKDIEEQVIADREEGMTYAAIVEKHTAHGVTMKWLRRVCKGIKVIKLPMPAPQGAAQTAINKILPLATRPIGVRPSEYHGILKEAYGTVFDPELGYDKLNCDNSKKSYVRSQVKKRAIG